jgi:dihydrolipoamide dehydrogenase
VTLHDATKHTLSATKEIIVATGSTPRSVPGIEVDRKKIIFSDEAIHLPAVPKSIAIMGSGAVGVEFASIFKSYGSEVTVIELLPRLVPGEDEAVSAELERAFKKRGIKVMTGAKVIAAKAGAKGVDLDVQASDPSTSSGQGGKTQKMTFELLLVATGRGPVTEGLDAEKLGLKMDRGYVVVDQLFKTNVPGISAIGDVITMGGPHYQLAHVSSMEGIVLAERIAGHAVQPINYDHVPRCTYTEPEIGSVGLTEAQAKAQGHEVRIGSFPFRALARARMAGETDGFVKIVAEKKYDEILGVHIIGPRATELVAEAVMALRMEVTVEELIKTIHAHPTMSEAVGEASHAAHGAAIHI